MKADLSESLLNYADLGGAQLQGAQLKLTELLHANLFRADLSNALLHGAFLMDADFNEAILVNADFTGATINFANFHRAKFNQTKLNNTYLNGTKFINTDIGTVEGLETVNHFAPSVIGIDTIYKSHGRIPESFLRGCGVPESLIIQISTLVASTEPTQFHSCFISYSSKDQEFAEQLYTDLQNMGVRCWFAPEDLKIGDG